MGLGGGRLRKTDEKGGGVWLGGGGWRRGTSGAESNRRKGLG